MIKFSDGGVIGQFSKQDHTIETLKNQVFNEIARWISEASVLWLQISSLNLLRVIAEQEGVPIEELNAGRVCDWFQKDKVKRETDMDSATLKWESNDW